MKIKSIVIAAALAGGLLSSASAVSTVALDKISVAPAKFEAPAPSTVVQPVLLPHRHDGSTVTLTMTIDAEGKPHNVRVMAQSNQEAYKQLVATVSQWQFTPARKNGKSVATRVELPLEVVGS